MNPIIRALSLTQNEIPSIVAGGEFSVSDSKIAWSPYNWDHLNVGNYGVSIESKHTACCGAYLKFRVFNTSNISLLVDSGLAYTYRLRVVINNDAAQLIDCNSTFTTVQIASGLQKANKYSVKIELLGTDETSGGTRYSNNPSVTTINALRIKSIKLDVGGVLYKHPILYSKKSIFFGDSITEGIRAAGQAVSGTFTHGRSPPYFTAPVLNAEVGVVGFGAQGWETGGVGDVPSFPSVWNMHSAGRPRIFSYPPDYAFVMHGTNGSTAQSTVQAWIAAARSVLGANTWIFIVIPPGGFAQSALTSAVSSYNSANTSDFRVKLINYQDIVPTTGLNVSNGGTAQAPDGIHPYESVNQQIGEAIATKVIGFI